MDLAAASGKRVWRAPALCLSQSARATFLGKGEELPGMWSFPWGPCFCGSLGHVPGLAPAQSPALPSKGISNDTGLDDSPKSLFIWPERTQDRAQGHPYSSLSQVLTFLVFQDLTKEGLLILKQFSWEGRWTISSFKFASGLELWNFFLDMVSIFVAAERFDFKDR